MPRYTVACDAPAGHISWLPPWRRLRRWRVLVAYVPQPLTPVGVVIITLDTTRADHLPVMAS